MGIGVIVEFNFEPGGSEAMTEVMKERFLKTRSWPGCEIIYLGTDAADPNRVFLVQKWTKRADYDRYLEWALEQPGNETIMPYLIGEMKTTYLDDTGA